MPITMFAVDLQGETAAVGRADQGVGANTGWIRSTQNEAEGHCKKQDCKIAATTYHLRNGTTIKMFLYRCLFHECETLMD